MIEGNRIDFDSYLKYSYSGMNNKGKSFKEIEDLKKSIGTIPDPSAIVSNQISQNMQNADFNFDKQIKEGGFREAGLRNTLRPTAFCLKI